MHDDGMTDDETSPSILFEVFALNQQLRELLDEAMRDSPLNPSDYAIVSAVFEDEAPTPTQLARRLGMPLSTTVEQVQAFERRGYLRRFPNPEDRRSYRVTLTAAGRKAHRRAAEEFELAYSAVVEGLGRVSEASVARALRALREAIESAQKSSTEPVDATGRRTSS
jgi:DNA-binding MarR family transcriptional regulator